MAEPTSQKRGVEVIEEFIKSLPATSGIYQMFGEGGRLLYVGKAINLQKRVQSYCRPEGQSLRIQRMISVTVRMEAIRTSSEAEALLLEANFIKKKKPHYNVDLRDDKTFPEILITDHPTPAVEKYRLGYGKRTGQFFGPFASASAVHFMLDLLQKVFGLRSCSESVFRNRRRPCLKYQIKRCSGPCVGLIGEEDYRKTVQEAVRFLKGQSQNVRQDLAIKMRAAADTRFYEQAALYRDRLQAVSLMDQKQAASLSQFKDVDLFALVDRGGRFAIAVMFFRQRINFGVHTFFPSHAEDLGAEEVLDLFVRSFYVDRDVPPLVVLNRAVKDAGLLEAVLRRRSRRSVHIKVPRRGDLKNAVVLAETNAQESLSRHASEDPVAHFRHLEELLALPTPLEQIAVFDNSHLQGTHALGAMVVMTTRGWDKSAYRRWDMPKAISQSDVDMMREAFRRHILRLKEDPFWWDGRTLFLVDGGKPQWGVVKEVFETYGLKAPFLMIAKGPERHKSPETFWRADGSSFNLPPRESLFFFLQRLRDEAHRFAVQSHRRKRARSLGSSALTNIEGIGEARRRDLLHFFGSYQRIREASVTELVQVKGLHRHLAKKIYQTFHPSES